MSRYEDGGPQVKRLMWIPYVWKLLGLRAPSDVDMMRDTSLTITDGAYSKLLFELFGKDRVEAELEEFLKFDFPRELVEALVNTNDPSSFR